MIPVDTLVDTSAWIEYDRASGSAVHRRLAALVAGETSIVVTEPVVMELMIGTRGPADEQRLRRLLERFDLEPFNAASDFDVAVLIYRRCRSAGFTPRGLIDCMVAAVAFRTDATLLCRDGDLNRIAEVMGIALDPASTEA